MKICTIGLGYIGLPTSIMFAKQNMEVVGVDIKSDVIELLNFGQSPIMEPGLQDAIKETINKGTFRASGVPERADAFIISVPTPNNNDQYKSLDISFILKALDSIIPYLEKGNLLIIESTIAPKTMEDFVKPIIEAEGFTIGIDLFLVHCPERVLPGNILYELIYNERVIGGVTPECTEAGAKLYSTFVKGKIIKTNSRTAEMVKIAENTYRDVNIALVNELTEACNALDTDVLDVINIANRHPRVNLHMPGPGVGGHCIPVDPNFLISKTPENTQLIQLSRRINDSMPIYVLNSIKKLMKQINGKIVTLFGITFKGNVDDIRNSPAIEIFNILKMEGDFEVRVYDPYVLNDIVEKNIESAISNSDLVVILSNHEDFKIINSEKLNIMNNPRVFDTVNVVANKNDSFIYINYGNLYQHLNKVVVPF
ncbi:nucleotide sugar dehydrogenase [Lysinibacillus sp. FSL P2-0066]|uniref:nucleotide sugar dehydrogenase n=1 Tax=Lysinibacillus sp. FSL P2-0066 TaxID=2921720 RepID=UPI0030D8D9FE